MSTGSWKLVRLCFSYRAFTCTRKSELLFTYITAGLSKTVSRSVLWYKNEEQGKLSSSYTMDSSTNKTNILGRVDPPDEDVAMRQNPPSAADMLARSRMTIPSAANCIYGIRAGELYLPSSLLLGCREPITLPSVALPVDGANIHCQTSSIMIEQEIARMRMMQHHHDRLQGWQSARSDRFLSTLPGSGYDKIARCDLSRELTHVLRAKNMFQTSLDSGRDVRLDQELLASSSYGCSFHGNEKNNIAASRVARLEQDALLRAQGYPIGHGGAIPSGSFARTYNWLTTQYDASNHRELESLVQTSAPRTSLNDLGRAVRPLASTVRNNMQEEKIKFLDSHSTSSTHSSASQPKNDTAIHHLATQPHCKIPAGERGSAAEWNGSQNSSFVAGSTQERQENVGRGKPSSREQQSFRSEDNVRGQSVTPAAKGKRARCVAYCEEDNDTSDSCPAIHRKGGKDKDNNYDGGALHQEDMLSSSKRRKEHACIGSRKDKDELDLVATHFNSSNEDRLVLQPRVKQQHHLHHLLAEQKRCESLYLQRADTVPSFTYRPFSNSCANSAAARTMLATVGPSILAPTASPSIEAFGGNGGFLMGLNNHPISPGWSVSNPSLEEGRPEETQSSALRMQSICATATQKGDEGKDRGTTGGRSFPLHITEDENNLSQYQVLARKQIEVFEASMEEAGTNAQGRNRPIQPGQIGIRCRHCARLPPKQRKTGAVYYPNKVSSFRVSLSKSESSGDISLLMKTRY